MKILLLNNNPVVDKLTTLSAQKTSDELSIAKSVEEVGLKKCDLLIIDDSLYSEEVMEELRDRVEFGKSLYVCSKDSESVDGFNAIIKKPFLPTDLVETLISLAKGVDTVELNNIGESNEFGELDETAEELHSFDNLDEDSDLDELDNLDGFDDFESMDDDINAEDLDGEDINLDELDEFEEDSEIVDDEGMDLEGFDEDENLELEQERSEGILDKDELKEVQNLLQESEIEDFSEAEDDLEEFETNQVDGELKELEFNEDDFESETITEDKSNEDDLIDELDDFDDLKEPEEEEPEAEDAVGEIEDLKIDEEPEPKESKPEVDVDEFEDLASQIECAVQELSDEDLRSEIDEDVLLNLGSLTSVDLKRAIGEEVDEESNEDKMYDEDIEDFDETGLADAEISKESDDSDGAAALKKLLKALSNEDVVASLKGMKISINITLGDK